MDDNLELAFMVLITIGISLSIGLSIGILLLTKLAEFIFCKDDDKEYNDIVEDNMPALISKSDEEKLKNAHKVRTQYPLPPQRKVENTELEITNIKDSIVVTETVYAD